MAVLKGTVSRKFCFNGDFEGLRVGPTDVNPLLTSTYTLSLQFATIV